MSRERRPFRRGARRGSVYVLLLMTTIIVTVIGVSSATLARIELRRSASAADAIAAQAAARAAIEFGFLQIRLESNWSNLGNRNANWARDVPFNGGTYSLVRTAFDNTDPLKPRLALLGVGKKGDAVYQLEVVIVSGAWVDTTGWTQIVN